MKSWAGADNKILRLLKECHSERKYLRLRPVIVMIIPFFAGWMLDLLLGDPVWLPHPTRLIVRFIQSLEPILRGAFPQTPRGERLAGNLLALLVPMVSMLIAALALAFAWMFNPGLWIAFETLLCYQLMATRSLNSESMRVCKLIENKDEHGDLSRARLALSRIDGRDTGSLNSGEITRASVETVAENTTGCVVAPMLFLAVGGGALGVFYKAVNMLGTEVNPKKDKYRDYGMVAAKLSDACDYIPARLAAVLMMASAWLLGLDFKNAVRIFKRDRLKRNATAKSSQTGSVCAGALGISLGGGAFYNGLFHIAPEIGDRGRPAAARDIRLANRLMLATSLLCVISLGALKLLVLCVLF